MPTLPIVPVSRPAVLDGQSNGKLPDSILVDTPGQAGGPVVRLVAPAHRAWRALAATALRFGHVLKPTSLFDSYRPYEIQERIFHQRYTTERLPDRPSKLCGGVRYWLLSGMAPAACPGTSNHGWGLAVDVGEERDQDTGTESMDTATLNWLVSNEIRFGWSHELAVEPWHIRYTAGDNIPAAVLAYEEDSMPLSDDDVQRIARAVVNQQLGSSGPTVGVALQSTHGMVKVLGPALTAQLDAVLAAALDDGDATVVLPPESIAFFTELRDAVTALPEAVADEQARRQAE